MVRIRFTPFFWIQLLTLTALWGYDNPAAKYCEALGYQYTTKHVAAGETGYCTFPDGSSADAWAFYKGSEARQFSYCEKNGYRMVTDQISKGSFRVTVPVCESTLKQAPAKRFDMVELMLQKSNISLQSSQKKDTNATLPATRIITTKTLRSSQKRTYPDALDWRNYNGKSYIGDVRNQGSCGDCYAFGAAAAAEGSHNLINNLTDSLNIDFSESYIAWCLGTYGDYSAHFDGCDGADYDYAELTALTVEGVTLESFFPYVKSDPGSCTVQPEAPLTVFKSWGRIAPNDLTGIQEALTTYGVIDVAVNTTSSFSYYSSGIYTDTQTDCPDGDYTTTDHVVSLVGWGTDPTEGLYWILRNSWGPSWGESGYMRIKAQAARVACAATYLEANSTNAAPVNPSVLMYLLN